MSATDAHNDVARRHLVAAMFMCASRRPAAFGTLEKKLAARVVTELESSIEKASTAVDPEDVGASNARIVWERLGPNLQAILNNTSVFHHVSAPQSKKVLWTDSFSNLFQILR